MRLADLENNPLIPIGFVGENIYTVVRVDCKKVFDQELDKDEYIRYMEFPEEEIFELERLGYINGANAKIGISRIRERGNRRDERNN